MNQSEANYWIAMAMQAKEVLSLFAVIFLLLYTHVRIIPKRDERMNEMLEKKDAKLNESLMKLTEVINDLKTIVSQLAK